MLGKFKNKEQFEIVDENMNLPMSVRRKLQENEHVILAAIFKLV